MHRYQKAIALCNWIWWSVSAQVKLFHCTVKHTLCKLLTHIFIIFTLLTKQEAARPYTYYNISTPFCYLMFVYSTQIFHTPFTLIETLQTTPCNFLLLLGYPPRSPLSIASLCCSNKEENVTILFFTKNCNFRIC